MYNIAKNAYTSIYFLNKTEHLKGYAPIKKGKDTIDEPYDALSSNCAQFVQGVLESAGLPNGKVEDIKKYSIEGFVKNTIPNIMFQSIINRNKNNENRISYKNKK